MTKKDAIIACMNGQKVCKTSWQRENYVVYKDRFLLVCSDGSNVPYSWDDTGNWEIYEEPLTWEEAYNHMAAGGECILKERKVRYRLRNNVLELKGCSWVKSTLEVNSFISATWIKYES